MIVGSETQDFSYQFCWIVCFSIIQPDHKSYIKNQFLDNILFDLSNKLLYTMNIYEWCKYGFNRYKVNISNYANGGYVFVGYLAVY